MVVASWTLGGISIRMRYILFFSLFLLFGASAAYPVEITRLEVKRVEHGEHIRIGLSSRVKYNIFMTDGRGLRLVAELPAATVGDDVGLPANYKDPIISNIRFEHKDSRTSRVVFDFIAPVKMGSAGMVYKNGYWLVFDVYPGAAPQHAVSSSYVASGKTKPVKSSKPYVKPIIILDAGHGGQDEGTTGYAQSKEKDLTLRYVESLKGALLDTGRYDVVLTRHDDTYLLLGERVRRARAANGNLFISIHADSSPFAEARGLSVYTISEKASDKQSEALAEKENKADIIGGMDLSATSKDVADILIDLTQRETRAKSNRFADMLVRNFRHEVRLLNHTHRFAGFAVLKAPDIPSVLIEVGFLTNPSEEKLLKTSAYQEKFEYGVIGAIDDYFARSASK